MMIEQRWTPGPWVIDPSIRTANVCTVYGLPVEQTDGQGWADIHGALGCCSSDKDEQMANAHLIAAAPDIYQALLDMRNFMAWQYGVDTPLVESADAALAKAKGETQ